VKDELARLPGVGDVQLFGARDYAMRIWLDPDKVAAHNLSASEVLAALRAQNVQVSAGILNQPPVPSHEAYQLNVQTLGRLSTPEQFADIVLKSDAQGRVTRLRNVGRVEVGAADYGSTAFTDRGPGLPLVIFAQPGANSLAVEQEVLSTMESLAREFPAGVGYKIIYDPTTFISKSVKEVIVTISSRFCSWLVSSFCSYKGGAPRSSRSSRYQSRLLAPFRFSTRSGYRSTTFRCSDWYSPWGLSWMTRSSWSRTSSVTCSAG
jgi:multidrug efflux pump subunit AcrB